MAPQAPWSPTAHAFAQHQFSHVVNFWKQGRHASFRMEALPSGRAELNLTFQLPPASEVFPPPSPVFPAPAPQRTIHPLFPKGFFPQRSCSLVSKPVCQKNPSSKQRKSYRHSVLPWLRLLFPFLRMDPDARLLLPPSNACRLTRPRQRTPKVPENDPTLSLTHQVPNLRVEFTIGFCVSHALVDTRLQRD